MANRWNLLWILPWMIVSVLFVEIVMFMPIYVLGLLVVPLAQKLAARKIYKSRLDASRDIEGYANPILDALFGNYEDGIEPTFDWWQNKTAFQWYLRNPVCNMRFWPLVSTLPSPNTQYIGSPEVAPDGTPCAFVAWSGPYAGARWQNTKGGIWFGYKINPRDSRYVPDQDYRRWGLGIAMQIMQFH